MHLHQFDLVTCSCIFISGRLMASQYMRELADESEMYIMIGCTESFCNLLFSCLLLHLLRHINLPC